jgi:hypothetical protein
VFTKFRRQEAQIMIIKRAVRSRLAAGGTANTSGAGHRARVASIHEARSTAAAPLCSHQTERQTSKTNPQLRHAV